MITESPDIRLSTRAESPDDPISPGIRRVIVTLGLTLMVATLWLLTHHYQGFNSDAKIYAFQALARIHTALAGDLYLQNTSQDQFTIFSPFYAACIAWFGLGNAALMLTVLFNVWIIAAAWHLARHFGHRDIAWLAVAFLVITAGEYGAAGIFHFKELYLTARLPAEALVVTAFACYFSDLRKLGFLVSILALFVHPLIALPGLLLLLCLSLPYRLGAAGAATGILAALGLAVATIALPAAARWVTVIDPSWLEVVHERSQFLFLQFWNIHDGERSAKPFIGLALSWMAIQDERVRRFCIAAMLVGGAGLVVALIASFVGSVAILLQGQAWRWVWVTAFSSVLLVPSTAAHIWQDKKCGPICAILLLVGWTFSAVDGTLCVLLAAAFWAIRGHITERAGRYLRAAALGLAAVVVVWMIANSWTLATSASAESGRESFPLLLARNILGLGVSAVLVTWFVWWWIRSARSLWVPVIMSSALLAGSAFSLPGAFKQPRSLEPGSHTSEFADWIRLIPPTSTVLVAPAKDTGAFVWFTLGRPNYLSIDQSAGVIFSRQTAMEVRRRSELLLPLLDPSWRVLTHNRRGTGTNHKDKSGSRPLTKASLMKVCTDEQLGFVIAPENVGFDPVRHTLAGDWKNWNLYDCRHVRSMGSET